MTPPTHVFLAENLRSKRGYLLLAVAVLVTDQWSKWWVETHLAPNRPLTVIPNFFDLTRVDNTGVAFGLFPAGGSVAGTAVLTLLGAAGFCLLLYYFLRTPRTEGRMLTALALILGGAVGNLADRIASGAVTDFFDVYVGSWHWYTFNVADSGITVGVLLMTWEMLVDGRRPSSEVPSDGPSDAASA